MKYLELDPSPSLRPIVRTFWSLSCEDAGPMGPDRIVPDGCPEIVLNRADPFRRFRERERSHRQAQELLVGPLTHAITVAPTGVVDLIGIRFEPGGLYATLGVPLHELVNADLSLTQIAPLFSRDLELGAGAQGLVLAREALELALFRQLERCRRQRQRPRSAHPIGRRGLLGSALGTGASNIASVDDWCAHLGLGRRALERLFRAEVGLSPKSFLRIERLQRVLRRLEGGPPTEGWAYLAQRFGYVDQSHLIREFKLLAGTTPGRYVADRTPIASAFVAR